MSGRSKEVSVHLIQKKGLCKHLTSSPALSRRDGNCHGGALEWSTQLRWSCSEASSRSGCTEKRARVNERAV